MVSKYRSVSISTMALGLAALAFVSDKASAAAPATPQGVITVREYLDIGGTDIPSLINNAKFPNKPDITAYSPLFEWPINPEDITQNPPGDVKNNYGVMLEGYIYPPTTGAYQFAIAADDNARLYLSTDDTPANEKLIAIEQQWNPVRAFGSQSRRSLVDTGTANERYDNISLPISLTKGKAYYVRALMKEGGGGDNIAIAWTTGGTAFNDGDQPISGDNLSSIDKTSGPVTFTTPPVGGAIQEGSTLTLSVEVNGTPGYKYQWKKNGTAIDGATSSVLTMRAKSSDGGSYTVDVTNKEGTRTSPAAVVTITTDTAAPTIAAVNVAGTLDTVVVTFSEQLDKASAENKANYSIDGGVTVNSATLGGGNKVVTLKTSAQTASQTRALTVRNVKDDSAAGNTIAANTTVNFKTQVLTPGFATREFYRPNQPGNEILDGTTQQKVWSGEIVPQEIATEAKFEIPTNIADNYTSRLFGYFVPPSNGNYVFYIAADDQAALYLSTDDKPANSVQIATEPQWNGERQWVVTDRRNPDAPENKSAPIPLRAGVRYYMEAYVSEGGGGDNLGVLAIKENDPAPNNGAAALTGAWIAAYADPNGQELEITGQPASATILENRSVTLKVAITTNARTVAYQWKKNGVNISGANTASYTTPKLQLADNGAKYSVEVVIAGIVKNSSEATITVNKDTVPPVVSSVAAIKREKANTYEITVAYDEEVKDAEAGAAANFSVTGGTITKAAYIARSASTVLTVTGLGAGASFEVTARNITDIFGNKSTESKKSGKSGSVNWAQVGGTEHGFAPAVAAVGDNGFDVYSGGSAFWNNYDETTFVYEKVTGDFDKKVRVQYQDSSSQWARAGLMVREVLNEEQGRDDTSVKFSRYQHVHVNPTIKWDGGAGNNGHELNQRLTPGAATTAPGANNNTAPPYPNAWVRLKRVGQEFSFYRSSDGVNWVSMGAQSYPQNFADKDADGNAVPPFPATLYVGPNFGPENGNITEADRKLWKVEFRDYGDVTSVTAVGPIAIKVEGNNAVLSWSGTATLQVADSVTGPYTDVAGATSPRTVTPVAGQQKYYRLKQ